MKWLDGRMSFNEVKKKKNQTQDERDEVGVYT